MPMTGRLLPVALEIFGDFSLLDVFDRSYFDTTDIQTFDGLSCFGLGRFALVAIGCSCQAGIRVTGFGLFARLESLRKLLDAFNDLFENAAPVKRFLKSNFARFRAFGPGGFGSVIGFAHINTIAYAKATAKDISVSE